MAALNQLAASGAIDSTAPVQAHVELQIASSPEKIWALLINAQNWPGWNPQVSNVSVPGSLKMGTRFVWSLSGTEIHSQVQLEEDQRRLAWTGEAMMAKAVHLWELRPTANGGTVVIVQESLEGPLVARFVSSSQLTNTDLAWLKALKTRAESHP